MLADVVRTKYYKNWVCFFNEALIQNEEYDLLYKYFYFSFVNKRVIETLSYHEIENSRLN